MLGLSVNVHSKCGSGSTTATVVVHVAFSKSPLHSTCKVYVVVVAGVSVAVPFRVG